MGADNITDTNINDNITNTNTDTDIDNDNDTINDNITMNLNELKSITNKPLHGILRPIPNLLNTTNNNINNNINSVPDTPYNPNSQSVWRERVMNRPKYTIVPESEHNIQKPIPEHSRSNSNSNSNEELENGKKSIKGWNDDNKRVIKYYVNFLSYMCLIYHFYYFKLKNIENYWSWVIIVLSAISSSITLLQYNDHNYYLELSTKIILTLFT